ncbi:carotene epsilon-monooxygenase, chloroplastic isoform X3 [Phoenix dactylifera]|uniref:Carotene epsilon-monooxygenase, chloroplastic isoform X3 n=1 Tax=Phoenix dactylifera TaxID=42345 RepID=A0A8B9AAI8_PHODC|nr:carotene epsilon-monooxygenase, chloroplastic isoform X3 [Phoenix dactylifera]
MASSTLLPSLLSPLPTLTQRRTPNHHFFFRRKPLPLVTASSLGNPPPRTKTKTGSGSGSWVSPDWLTALARSLSPRDDSGIPVANAKLEDVSDLLGGALFLPLFKWMLEYGPIYRLAAGPRNFVVVSDPAIAKHVLRSYGTKYAKGLVSEVSQFLFGSGFAIAEDSLWTIYLLRKIIPRQIKAEKAVTIIRKTVEELITKCKEIVEAEDEQIDGEEYVNESDPSVLRFLLASREEVGSVQLRDDLLSMLVAGHETTGSVLTWTLYLLSKDSSTLIKAQQEVDEVLQGRLPRYEDVKELKYLMRCINESMRLYPHPPVLIRRAQVADILPGDYKVNAGQDIMISVYNIHRSPQVWDRAEEFLPERFDLEGPVPNETNTDFRFIPFSGGPRKCVGDQFALLEAIVALAIFLQHMDFRLVPDQNITMTTGATIHTVNGLYMTLSPREVQHDCAFL